MTARYQELLQGKYLPVRLFPKTAMCYKVFIGQFPFSINREFGLEFNHGDEVFVQLHLWETKHPRAYADRALLTDPATRLAVLVEGHDRNGEFHVWLVNRKGARIVQKVNHLVDILEGYSLEETKTFSRRWISTKKRENGKRTRETTYTK